ncbi:YALIA101S02e12046g1_1 [Yarrowia lipolytica]|nr:Metal resistance protein YCF1 [Yarrowia lipolytica]SEI32206.1 YALIA101S02e12046g1_1 [Yarrowia lipolytica]
MVGLCSHPEQWGISLLYDLTPCTCQALSHVFPSAIALIWGTREVVQFANKPNNAHIVRRQWDYWLKQSASVALILSLLYDASRHRAHPTDIFFWSPLVLVAATVEIIYLQHVEAAKSRIASSAVLWFWFTLAIGGLLETIGDAIRALNPRTALCTTFVASLVFSLECWVFDPRKSLPHMYQTAYEDLNPIEYANIASRSTFGWLGPLLKTGYSKVLTIDDIPACPTWLKTAVTHGTFEQTWQKQLRKKNPSLLWTITAVYGPKYLFLCVYNLGETLVPFIQPFLLRQLILVVTDYRAQEDAARSLNKPLDPDSESGLITKGIMVVTAMLALSLVQIVSSNKFIIGCFNMVLEVTGALSAAIHNKTLTVSPEAKADTNSGDIVNLMSTDVPQIAQTADIMDTIWGAPLGVVVCLTSIYFLIGKAMWAGVFVMSMNLPINAVFAYWETKFYEQIMAVRDKRTAVTTEVLTNIKSLKFYSWEKIFYDKVCKIRNGGELALQKKILHYEIAEAFSWSVATFVATSASFAVYTLGMKQPLTTDVAFPVMALYGALLEPLGSIPYIITHLLETGISIGRIAKYLKARDLQPDAVTHVAAATVPGQVSVTVENGSFGWDSRDVAKDVDKLLLTDMNFEAKKGQIVCVVGKVGSGKTTFLHSLLGETYKHAGQVTVAGRVAYVAQSPWIMNATIKDNIVFGSKFDADFYAKVVDACALKSDFAILKDGDQTEVGEKGIALSGGQKARLGLARAVYSRADIILLDDPLSAVDEHVQHHIIQEVLGPNGLLQSKTKVLATNTLNALEHANMIYLIQDKTFVEKGSFEEVSRGEGQLSKLIKDFGRKGKKTDTSASASDLVSGPTTPTSMVETDPVLIEGEDTVEELGIDRTLTLRRASTAEFVAPKGPKSNADERDSDRVNQEIVTSGDIKSSVYVRYAKALGLGNLAMFLLCNIMVSVSQVAANYWLKDWAERSDDSELSSPGYYLTVYFILGIASGIWLVLELIFLHARGAIQAGIEMHAKMLACVLRAPMSFFETTPLGRITNRFSGDLYKIDANLPSAIEYLFNAIIAGMASLLVIVFATPMTLLFIIPLLVLFYRYQKYYIHSSREVRRLVTASRSPVYAHFQETLNGVSTIRGYARQATYEKINQARTDVSAKVRFIQQNLNRWLSLRLRVIAALVVFATGLFSILSLRWYNFMNPGIMGIVMTYALNVTWTLVLMVRMAINVETHSVSVERVWEYCELKSEAITEIPGCVPPSWPEKGSISFNDYSTRYREGLDPVLKGISLDIKHKEKIGIVGRTGAGKSSLTLSLFRIIEAIGGNISIDGVDISKLGLRDLRQRLSIIPQDSQIFEGTIRENLDPSGTAHTDEEIWKVLELSHLAEFVRSSTDSDGQHQELLMKINEGGSNLSAGQKQLMCLGRALLNPSPILILDEATAAVDVETDKILQQTIRTEFKEKTILTIAHRLNTILDSDRIIVLSAGQVEEFDTPQNLLKNHDSLFYKLCERGGFVDGDEIKYTVAEEEGDDKKDDDDDDDDDDQPAYTVEEPDN